MRQRILQFVQAKTPFSQDIRAATSKLAMLLLWAVALVLHILFLFYFYSRAYMPLAWFQVGGIVFYAFLLPLIRRNRLVETAFFIVIEVIAFCLMSVCYFGVGALMQWYLILLLIPIYFYVHCKNIYRFLITVLVLLGMAACLLTNYFFIAPLAGSPSVRFLFYLNSVLIIFCLVLEITTEKIVRHALLQLLNKDVERLRRQSFRDPLTDLFNRRYADILFGELARKAEESKEEEESEEGKARQDEAAYCIAMLDIDDFSVINDTFGHDVGDMVLRRVAVLIRENTRPQDIAFRWGGEEFLVLYRDAQLARATLLAACLRERILAERENVQMDILFPTVTIGLAKVYEHRFDEAIRVADINLYEGKHNGKDCVVH